VCAIWAYACSRLFTGKPAGAAAADRTRSRMNSSSHESSLLERRETALAPR